MAEIAEQQHKRRVRHTVEAGGTVFVLALGFAFVILRAAGVISWSLWLVLLPFYGMAAVALFLLIGTVIYMTVKDKDRDEDS